MIIMLSYLISQVSQGLTVYAYCPIQVFWLIILTKPEMMV